MDKPIEAEFQVDAEFQELQRVEQLRKETKHVMSCARWWDRHYHQSMWRLAWAIWWRILVMAMACYGIFVLIVVIIPHLK